MTEQEKKERTKKNIKRVWDGGKLVVAIGALTAAVNGYAELSKKSVQLSEQNALLFKALSTKVNSMAEKMAYLEGRLEGLNEKKAEEAVKEKIIQRPALSPASFGEGGGAAPEVTMMHGVEDEPEEVKPTKAKAKTMAKPPQAQEMTQQQDVQYKAYEQLPDNLEALIQVQQQQQGEL